MDAFVVSFFFQAEDGIRDLYVTGVQTCALPICPALNMLSTNVVRAKPASPSGAGSAMEVATTSTGGAALVGSLSPRAASRLSAIGTPPVQTVANPLGR